MSDLSLDVKAESVTDSSACKGLCSRRGARRIRHIHCLALWLQHAVAQRQIAITRRAGKDLAPDVGTKAGIPEDTMWRLLGMFGLAKGEGRAKQALNMAGRQAKAWGHGYVTFARPILNDVHSSHPISRPNSVQTALDVILWPLLSCAKEVLEKRPTLLFELLEPVQSHMCVLSAIRVFSFFFPWSGLERQEACSSVIHGATYVNWARWFSLFCTVSRGKTTDCGFILCRISICW